MTSRLSAAERSYPTSEVRGEARRTPCLKGSGQDELPHVRGQGQKPGVPHAQRAVAKGVTPHPRSGAAAGRSNPTPEARGSSQEDQSRAQGAVAAWAQEGLEELSHVEGQEGRR